MKFQITVLPRIDRPWRIQIQMQHDDKYIVQVYFMYSRKSTDVHFVSVIIGSTRKASPRGKSSHQRKCPLSLKSPFLSQSWPLLYFPHHPSHLENWTDHGREIFPPLQQHLWRPSRQPCGRTSSPPWSRWWWLAELELQPWWWWNAPCWWGERGG